MVSFLNSLIDLIKNLEGTPWAPVIPTVIVLALGYAFIKWIVIPSWKGIRHFCLWLRKKRFAIHESLSYMQSADVYYAIDHYIPTRYSARDPAYGNEPVPEYMGEEGRREPLLLEHFLKYEFDQRHGGKFYLCLGDCGMGKTTFLINLFYAALKQKKHPCAFVSLVQSDCLSRIERIPEKEKTILLLDALDENDAAMRDFGAFMDKLENGVQDFYRVIITSRTNFFANAEKENLFHGKSAASTTEKISGARKYYIAPFTDEDIQHYLHQRYHGKKYRQAWTLVDENKNLSVRPLLLRYMDDMIREDIRFSHDFELYEYLFRKWIAREADKTADARDKLYQECLTLAKAMYYQWMKDGRVGVYPQEIDEAKTIPGLSTIRFRGHAILNRTSDGMYKFAHRSYWEYLLAQLALRDPVFSEDLLIRNFEQAESFLKEMIQAAGERTVAMRLGIANYYLKYWRPEEAERILLEVLEDGTERSEEEDLFALIHLIRSYRYQWKEASAEEVLLSLHDRLNHMELTPETVPLFTQFGLELAHYSRDRTLKTGQAFLRKVIEFCKAHIMPGYDAFRCYESLCYCVLSYAAKETILTEMCDFMAERLDNEGDEYVEYLYAVACIWRTSFDDANSLSSEKALVTTYERFLDCRDTIVRKCDMACSVAAVYQGDGDRIEKDAKDYLDQAYDVCCEIYDSEFETVRNPYIALITDYTSRYHLILGRSEPSQEDNEKLLAYRHYAHLEEEMQTAYCSILRRAGRNTSVDFRRREAFLREGLNWAQTIRYSAEEIDALWDLFSLYHRSTETESDGQAELKAAFDLAQRDSSYRETRGYCELLQVMIDYYYKGDLDKNALYDQLRRITPGIYGSDARRGRIYRCLRNYAVTISDSRGTEDAVEVLRCEFDRYELDRCYDVYTQFADEAQFIGALKAVLQDMPELSEQCLKELDAFLYPEDRSHPSPSDETEPADKAAGAEKKGKVSRYSPEFSQKVQETVRRIQQEKKRTRYAHRRI